jgi:hypothetical protein
MGWCAPPRFGHALGKAVIDCRLRISLASQRFATGKKPPRFQAADILALDVFRLYLALRNAAGKQQRHRAHHENFTVHHGEYTL